MKAMRNADTFLFAPFRRFTRRSDPGCKVNRF
jgi:hypothetical protein